MRYGLFLAKIKVMGRLVWWGFTDWGKLDLWQMQVRNPVRVGLGQVLQAWGDISERAVLAYSRKLMGIIVVASFIFHLFVTASKVSVKNHY